MQNELSSVFDSLHVQDLPACPVHDCREVAEPLRHGDVGYVRAPDVVGLCDIKPVEKIGIDPVSRMGLRKAGFFVDRLDTHLPHEGPDVDPSGYATFVSQFAFYAARTEVGHLEMDFVDQAHELPVFIGDRDRDVVDA